MMDYKGDAPDEYEQIPWSQLVPVKQDRSMQLALAALAVVAVLLAGLFLIRRSPDVVPIAPATAAQTPAAPAQTVPAPVTTMQPITAPPAPSPSQVVGPQIYSEADLMAAIPPATTDRELLAIARAELFVADYFTVDGDVSLGEGINASLPDAVDLPQTDGSLISYVEWVRAVAVEATDRNGFAVTVWFRTLVGNDSAGFSRTPVRAVNVELEEDGLGRLAVADLPIVQAVAAGGIAGPRPDSAVPPPAVVAAALDSAGSFGSGPELAAAGQDEKGWRLLFAVGDASGLRFPVVVRVSAEQ